MRKDLEFAVNKNWFGHWDDAVPKHALHQILDADKGFGLVYKKDGIPGMAAVYTVEDVKRLMDEGCEIRAILSVAEMEEVVLKLT